MKLVESNNANLEKIKKVSRVISGISSALMYIMIVGIFLATLALIFLNGSDAKINVGDLMFPMEQATTAVRVLSIGLVFLAGAVFVFTFLHLKRLFKLYSEGEIFTEGTVKEIKNLGFMLILWAIFEGILFGVETLIAAIIELDVSVTFDISAIFLPLFIGIIVQIIARIMDEGRRLKEDIDLTI